MTWWLRRSALSWHCLIFSEVLGQDAAAAAKSLQSCPTLCDPIDSSPTRLPCPWDSQGKNTGVGCHFLLQCMKVKSESEVAQLCPLSDPMDCSPPGSSIHGIFQARVLEWGAIAFSRDRMAASSLLILTWLPCIRSLQWSPAHHPTPSMACPNLHLPHCQINKTPKGWATQTYSLLNLSSCSWLCVWLPSGLLLSF